MINIRLVAASALALVAFSPLIPFISQASASPDQQYLIAAKTQQFKEKEGFQRREKDIINTLKENDVANFSTLLDGLHTAFADEALKDNGPFTLFAPSDEAFKKLPDDDRQSLWGNPIKLKQVLQYHIVPGKIDGATLRKNPTLKSLEGHSITISTKGDDIYADKSMVTTTDIPCSNGVIHVLDEIIMPPLRK